MKVAIVGSSGYIAQYLINSFQNKADVEEVLKIDKTGNVDIFLDLLRPEEFPYQCLKEIQIVIFTAAISGPDQCASDFSACWSVNVTGTGYFISEAIRYGCKVLFFSSDAVYGDISGRIFTEKDETKAVTPYGRMKKAIEDKFKENSSFKAVRLAYVVSAKDKFVSYCLRCITNHEAAEVYHPFYRNCIVVSDVVRVVLWFCEHWEEYPGFVLNVAGRELVSRVRIADEINRIMGKRLKYLIREPGEAFYRNRPQITQMESLYIQQFHIIQNSSFTEKIRIELETVKL